jgi:hypothetical protein
MWMMNSEGYGRKQLTLILRDCLNQCLMGLRKTHQRTCVEAKIQAWGTPNNKASVVVIVGAGVVQLVQ